MSGPLHGVRVIDCTTVVLGPWAAQQLGDLGAEVIKVEPPEGDTTRQLGPMRNPDMGAFFLAVNRNKRSIVLDLKQESARKVLLKLAENAEVFMHNYRPRAAKRLGLSYEMFRAVNPRLVYVGTYGFRATGPYADKPAYDDIIQAASGLASLQSALTGEPRFVPTIVADKTSSMTLFAAVLAALYHQARTGEGQEVEVPMFESLAAWIMVEHLYGESFVPPIDSVGYKRVLSPHRKPFKTKTATWPSFLHGSELARLLRPQRPPGSPGRSALQDAGSRLRISISCTASGRRSRSRARTPSGWPSWTAPTFPP
jgi:crotonobetainyl-CoA:carnitine CoA-transferase CaiB-like acyl-CoA transferase